jgi:hypothetical protein
LLRSLTPTAADVGGNHGRFTGALVDKHQPPIDKIKVGLVVDLLNNHEKSMSSSVDTSVLDPTVIDESN